MVINSYHFRFLLLCLVSLGFNTFVSNQETTERFYSPDTNIIDSYGNVFVPVRTNLLGTKWVWPGKVAEDADLIIDKYLE